MADLKNGSGDGSAKTEETEQEVSLLNEQTNETHSVARLRAIIFNVPTTKPISLSCLSLSKFKAF